MLDKWMGVNTVVNADIYRFNSENKLFIAIFLIKSKRQKCYYTYPFLHSFKIYY